MPAVKFDISNQDIANNPKYATFSQNEKYHTVRTDENGKKTFDGFCSGYQIENGEIAGIPSSEIRLWCDAVEEFIYNHNEDVYNNKGFDIKFNILDHDSRMAFKYEEYSNGKLVKSGIGWAKDFETGAERDSWIEAVNKYKKDHGIKTPFDKIKGIMGSIDKAVDSLDDELPPDMSLEIPNIASAIPKVSADPCEFMSAVKQAAMTAAGIIAGMPTPKDVYNYSVKTLKHNTVSKVTKTYDEQTAFVRDVYEPMTREMMGTEEYFAEVDALWEEINKENSDSVCLFETVLEPPYVYKPPVFDYNNDGRETIDNNNMLQGNVDVSNIPSYTPNPLNNVYNYKELTFESIRRTSSSPRPVFDMRIIKSLDKSKNKTAQADIPLNLVESHIREAMRNLFIPIRRGWEEYCKKNLNGMDPTWQISSGYRPFMRNNATGGSAPNSAHRWGFAIDVQFLNRNNLNWKVEQLYKFAVSYAKSNRLTWDQIIIETSSTRGSKWLHMGYKLLDNKNGIVTYKNQRFQTFSMKGA